MKTRERTNRPSEKICWRYSKKRKRKSKIYPRSPEMKSRIKEGKQDPKHNQKKTEEKKKNRNENKKKKIGDNKQQGSEEEEI